MKKVIKVFALILCLLCVNVNAETSTRAIDASSCKNVYTNYYFLLEANTADYFTAVRQNTNVGTFENNVYLSTFDEKNIGYGQVTINKNSTTSSDGITSWSLEDYYKMYDQILINQGSFNSGSKMYIGHTKWFHENVQTQTRVEKSETVSLSNIGISNLVAASVDAKADIERETEIASGTNNDFNLSITRTYDVNINEAGSGVRVGDKNWYLQPQVYYVQYCESNIQQAPAQNTSVTVTTKYKINYDKNTPDNVSNMPNSEEFDYDKDALISTLIPTREGYTFLGWGLSPTDTKVAYNNGDTYTNRKDLTLYAIWQPKGSYEGKASIDNPQTDLKISTFSLVGGVSAALSGLVVLFKKGFLKQL